MARRRILGTTSLTAQTPDQLKTFLLIHGGSHGAWCWERLIAELESRGHRAYACDLPGHGTDRTNRANVDRSAYVEAVVRYVDKKDLRDLTIVGHSLAGTILPEVWARLRGRVDRLIFFAALVLADGEAAIDLIPEGRRPSYYQMAAQSADNSFLLEPSRARTIFFNECSQEDAEQFSRMLTPQPFGVYTDRSPNAPQLPIDRVRYILCTKDRALPEDLCHACASKLGVLCENIDSDHCAMLSHPVGLADLLLTETRPDRSYRA